MNAAVLKFEIPRGAKGEKGDPGRGVPEDYTGETWTFTLLNGTTITKRVWCG
ncbi:MAG: hypothetical protein II877_01585 [Synergistaceae bacterium]|nr:hypothetical protein [Synergistaceae bacterium]